MVASFEANAPVMPEGHADAANVTVPLNPFNGVTATVDVPVDPATTAAGPALSAKLGAALTVRAIVAFAVTDPLVPTMDNE